MGVGLIGVVVVVFGHSEGLVCVADRLAVTPQAGIGGAEVPVSLGVGSWVVKVFGGDQPSQPGGEPIVAVSPTLEEGAQRPRQVPHGPMLVLRGGGVLGSQ